MEPRRQDRPASPARAAITGPAAGPATAAVILRERAEKKRAAAYAVAQVRYDLAKINFAKATTELAAAREAMEELESEAGLDGLRCRRAAGFITF